jgi:hypothetical protein
VILVNPHDNIRIYGNKMSTTKPMPDTSAIAQGGFKGIPVTEPMADSWQALAGMMIQHTIGQPLQNPEVMQHLCTFLSHDSDNRLKWFQTRDQQRHVFRMTALVIVAILSGLVLPIPLVALWRSDMAFVKEFLERYLTQIIMVALALLGGGKLFDLLK